jgi:hypothetical protein
MFSVPKLHFSSFRWGCWKWELTFCCIILSVVCWFVRFLGLIQQALGVSS